ncbi:MAG: ABC transporter permease subunit [Phycisphaera sp.]|nr:ABC transporter permease subunit [Phycisphaera sp.]
MRRRSRTWGGFVGWGVVLCVALPCVLTLPWSLGRYDKQNLMVEGDPAQPPSWGEPMGTDHLGRSLMWRCLLGGAISLGVGTGASLIAVVIGVAWGSAAGYAGGRTDAALMRIVDVLYALPYILLVMMLKMVTGDLLSGPAEVAVLFAAIGGVSWLTMARVIRGQVLSLKAQPFVEAARAIGIGPMRIVGVHMLPNLVGPIVVYATLAVPTAILSESFLSFLGIGVRPPLPSWGNLAAEGLPELHRLGWGIVDMRWWLIFWPCALLAVTLLALNFIGESLRKRMVGRSQ